MYCVHLGEGTLNQQNKESCFDQGLQSASDVTIISYPKWKSSNGRSCEIHFRAVINMTLRNLAGMQQIQALIWSDLMLPKQIIDHSFQNAARSPGSGSLKIFRSLLQVSSTGQASTFLPSSILLMC